jgi:hypothetical protein
MEVREKAKFVHRMILNYTNKVVPSKFERIANPF